MAKKDGGGPIYGFGFIGSLIYFAQASSGFGGLILALLKAIVWPAYITYKLLEQFYGVVI